MRVVLDTNILVSYVLVPIGKPGQLLLQCKNGEFELLLSKPILEECAKVLRYKRIRTRHKLDDEQIDQAVTDIGALAAIISVNIELDAVPEDPKDNMVVECALAGGADYIVSGDRHLLDLGEYEGIRIVTPSDFLRVLDQLRGHYTFGEEK